MAEKLATVREHADKLLGDMVKNGQIAPDAGSAAAATGMPTFSKGTATLDPNTGAPVAPKVETPAFTEGAVAVPEGVTSAAPIAPTGAEAATSREAILAAHQQRVAGGEQPAVADAPAAAAGAAAAEQAAQAVQDAFAEFSEIEIEDADLDLKYPIRVPKQYETSVKRGYQRRAAFDRAMSYAKNADPVLRQLIESGQINQVLPLIQAAITNDAYGQYVAQGFERISKGLPLIERAAAEAAAAGAAPPAPVTPLVNYDEDPFFAERIAPIVERYQTLEQKFAALEAEKNRAAQQQQEQYQLNLRRANEMQAAHQDLHATFPAQYTGDLQRDQATWNRTIQYAKDAGYVDAYGLRAGIVFAGQQINLIEQERLAATASPTATAMQAAEAQQMDIARREAAAASRTVGGGAPLHATPPPRPMPPSPRNADGTLKPAGQFLRENQAYIAANGAAV